MSETTTRIPLAEAERIADGLVGLLGRSCVRIEVAGSIRRRRPDVGDIDLVCEPKRRPLVDMFGDPIGEDIDDLHERLCDLERTGVVEKRRNALGHTSWGRALKRARYHGLGVDVQSVTDPDAWGFWLLIRTGPAGFNKAIVTPRHQGGLLPPGFEVKDGFQLWRFGGRVPTPTERDVFEALGLPYLEPWERQGPVPGGSTS